MDNTTWPDWLTNGIPLGSWVESLVAFLLKFKFIWSNVKLSIQATISFLEQCLLFPPPWLIIILLCALAFWISKKWGLPLFILLGLLLIWNLGFWVNMMYTLALVLTSSFISIILGVPLGIWAAQKARVRQVMTPLLDFMQTMPAFVYLIPAVFFFGIGAVSGVIASVIFAMPPTIRLTILGIQQVPQELIEASDSFGATSNQKLFKVQLPLAKQTIMAGINQTIMLSLSMVVIASMVGAKGLGRDVLQAVTGNKVGLGFESGISVVILAIILDRLSQYLGNKPKKI